MWVEFSQSAWMENPRMSRPSRRCLAWAAASLEQYLTSPYPLLSPDFSEHIRKHDLTFPYPETRVVNSWSDKSRGSLAMQTHWSELPTHTDTSLFLTNTFSRAFGQSSSSSGTARLSFAPGLYLPSLFSSMMAVSSMSGKAVRISWNSFR